MSRTPSDNSVTPTIRISARRYTFALTLNDEASSPVGDAVSNPRSAATVARAVIGSEITECVLVIFLDARHRVTRYAEVARGTINASRLSPRDVLVPSL